MAEPPDETGTPLSAWMPCPPGTFERLARTLRARRHRRVCLGSAAAAMAVAAGAGGTWFLLRPTKEVVYDYGGITCPKVVELGPEYAKGELSKELHDNIHLHISRCPNCGPYYKAHGWTT